MTKIAQALAFGLEKHETIALVTLIEVQGSVPQEIGAKMLVSDEGRFFGTVGGGNIEHLAIEAAKRCITEKKPELINFILNEDGEIVNNESSIKTKMLCGGEASIFIDILGITDQILIFGGGHIAQKLTPILQDLGFSVSIIENRSEYAKKELSGADKYIVTNHEDVVNLNIPKNSYIVVITHSHSIDEKIVYNLLKKYKDNMPWKYLGMIGSKNKVEEIFERLNSKGIEKTILETVYAPIGKNLGKTHTPIEIAISIAAEIIEIKNKEE